LASSLSQAKAAGVLSDWRLTPATMMNHLDKKWIPAAWLQYLSLKIATAVSKGSRGLLISAPPRHGKSMLSTIATPLWVLENFPEKQVIVATYGEELSTDFTRTVRDLINQNQEQLEVRLRQDARRVTNLLTPQGGGLKAVGLQGTITGRGADVLVIDDYIKNPKEAMSPSYLEDLWTWWRTVARTRLEPGAVVIILATRWVAKDLHGRLMAQQKETGREYFEYVELPAIARDDETDPIGRNPGDVLFPERYDQQSVLDIKAELGTRWFNAMFQQRPDDDETKAVDPDWFQKISKAEFRQTFERIKASNEKMPFWVRGWDLASTKEAGDYTVGAKCLYDPDTENFYIVELARGQWSSFRVEEEFAAKSNTDRSLAMLQGLKYKIAMEEEPGSSGAYTTNHFQGILSANEIFTRIAAQKSTNSKLLNAQPLLAAAENGKVFVVCLDENGETEQWAKNLYNELEDFPEGENDDQVDSLSVAYKEATGKKPLKPTFGRTSADATPKTKPAQPDPHAGKRMIGVTFGRRLARAY
jgi:predicted phage terminase large subunit-like protein